MSACIGAVDACRLGGTLRRSLATVRADASDFDHRAFRYEAGRAARMLKSIGDSAAGCFADPSAALANEKHDQIAAGVMMHAGNERVAALDAMDEVILPQEVECAIDRDRRQPAAMCQSLDDLIGAKRLVTCQ